ncbi:hypothetical protein D3C71_1749860 [compost metagenome]
MHQTLENQIFLFLEIVGDAVRAQAHLLGHLGQHRALDPMLIEKLGGDVDDRLALFHVAPRIALGCGAGLDADHILASPHENKLDDARLLWRPRLLAIGPRMQPSSLH